MLELFRHTLESSPILALFLVIGAGYALGRVSVFGFSLGVGGVLLAGLALGAFAPGSVPPPLVGSIGLLLFLYGHESDQVVLLPRAAQACEELRAVLHADAI